MRKSQRCVQLFVTPWTMQSMEFSRPEYWSGQLFPSPGDLPFNKETETIKKNQKEILKLVTTLAGEFYQIFKEELMQSFANSSKEKIKEEGIYPNEFYDASIILIQKPDKNTTKRLQINILNEYRYRNSQQNTSKPNATVP